tara:strand:- start:15853 stop:17823 length:1971 start_codon:yes stop_codon:yes gene_type:complete
MAIKYPGEQKIGYGKAQIFDTSKLAEGAWKAGEKLSLKRKEKKKAKDEFVKNLKDIDVSNIRQVDTDYITGNVNAVSEYFYKNSAAILNPKLDGGKAAMEVQRLKAFAVGEVQKSIGIKEEDKMLNDRIISDKDHFGTHENYTLHNTRIRTAMNHPMWNDHETPVTEVQVSTAMTEQERTEFYKKSKDEQREILQGRIPMQVALDDYNSLETVEEKQQWLVDNNYDLGDTGDNDDGVDGDWGDLSEDAEEKFIKKANKSIEEMSSGIGAAGNISNYETFEEYQNTVSPHSQIHLNEDEFNSLKDDYNKYETTWNESQGTFETKTEGGNTVVGLHNRQLNANPMLGDHIMKYAKEIVPKNLVIEKGGKWQVGEGNVTQFNTKVEADRQSIIDALNGSIAGHRFNPEMEKELLAELTERQKINPEFTREDLIVEKALPYVQYENKTDLVRDIFKPKGSSFTYKGGGPEKIENVGAPIEPVLLNLHTPSSKDRANTLEFTSQGTGVAVQITESTTGKSTFNLKTTASGWRQVEMSNTGKNPKFSNKTKTFKTFRPIDVQKYFTATDGFTWVDGSGHTHTFVEGDIVPNKAAADNSSDIKKAHWLNGHDGTEPIMIRLDDYSKGALAQWMITRTKGDLNAVKEAFRKGGINYDFSKIANI